MKIFCLNNLNKLALANFYLTIIYCNINFSVQAVTCTADNNVISGTCSDLTINVSNASIVVSNGAIVTQSANLNAVQANNLGNGVSNLNFTNYGLINANSVNSLNSSSTNVGGFLGSGSNANLSNLINAGQINAQSGNVLNNSLSGFLPGSGSVYGLSFEGPVQTITNSGLINLSSGSVNNSATGFSFGGSSGLVYGFIFNGGHQISAFTNSGTMNLAGGNVINGGALTFGGSPYNIYGVSLWSNLNTLINSGTMNLSASSVVNDFSGGLNFGGSGGRAYGIIVGSGISPPTSSNYNLDLFINSGSINLNGGTVTNIALSGFAPPGGFLLGLSNNGLIGTILNNGSISGSDSSFAGIYNGSSTGTIIASFINNGSISANSSSGSLFGVNNNSVITNFINNGLISNKVGSNGSAFGVYNANSSSLVEITTLINNGQIIGSTNTSAYLVGIYNGENSGNSSTIGTLTNMGVISVDAGSSGINFGIVNRGIIGTLNNAQGGNSSSLASSALTYSGVLPVNYNTIVTSRTHYGQLAATNVTGATNFGISPSSYVTLNYIYSGVLQGFSSSNINGVSGATLRTSSNGYTYQLNLVDAVSGIWDLIVTSAPVHVNDTQQSLVNTASVLQGIYTLQNSVMVNSFTYDCSLFDKHGICVSAGGRNTTVQAQGINNTSGLLIASYRLDKNNSRIGTWVDQNLSASSTGAVKLSNSTPMIGLFGVWNQRPDGVGAEVKVSAAYGQKDLTITRSTINTSEPGFGNSQLISQGVQVAAKFGFAVVSDVVVSPYVGVRYTKNSMGGYTEATTSAVTTPLTYSALNTNATTALAGAEARYRGIPKTTLFASAGVETDTNTSNGTYFATGITGLTPVNFTPNPVKTRPTATVGGYYDLLKNQRIGITGIYRQEAYQAVSTTTVLATYTIGL